MMAILLRLSGASLVVLSIFHLVLWRMLGWTREIAKLEPLNARVFAVHTFFLTFVLFGLGVLSGVFPELLLVRSELSRLLLVFIVLFWVLRLLIQLVVFDPVLWIGKPWRSLARVAASVSWLGYVVIYGIVLWRQL
jgi:hypothetical protein